MFKKKSPKIQEQPKGRGHLVNIERHGNVLNWNYLSYKGEILAASFGELKWYWNYNGMIPYPITHLDSIDVCRDVIVEDVHLLIDLVIKSEEAHKLRDQSVGKELDRYMEGLENV